MVRRLRKVKKTAAHPGFKAVQSKIASRLGISKERAGAVLAKAGRRASPSAIRKNPRLKRIAGVGTKRKKR